MEEDGGYYAIKGFDFQIDKTILALFKESSPDEKIAIEQIQDVNTDTTVIQVKYKETQNFANSKIREPVVKLIDEFIADTTGKTFVLYCYFKDKSPCSISFIPAGIDDILNIKLGRNPSKSHRNNFDKIQSITSIIRQDFSKKFVLQFADSYDAHFSEVLNVIAAQTFCGSNNEAPFLYHIIADYLRKIVISNTDKSKRVCSRNDISILLNTGKRAIFNSIFSQIKSRKTYLSFLKSKAQAFYANQNNCVLIGASPRVTSPDKIANLINGFLRDYFLRANRDVNPPMFLIRDDMVFEVKRKLVESGCPINDGYEQISFSPEFLIGPPVANLKMIGQRATDSLGGISFKVRVASLSKISELENKYTPDRVMYFDVPEVDRWSSVPMFSVDDLDYDEVLSILKVVK
ncbi:hypothetical protein [Comamonas aquatica]|uniref:hypothetical protein n=1 Tax=Comamonas aquatica TaxID=225991 RepID=UPI0034D76A82